MFEQRTPRAAIEFRGRGLHTGRAVGLTLAPAPANSGILFVRTDRGGHVIPARREYLEATRLSTSLARNGIRVGTVEHVLAALVAMGVDNARLEVDGPEVPILDGSAAPFATGLLEVGLTRQTASRRYLTVTQPIEVEEGDRRLAVFPSNDLKATYAIDFSNPAIGYQEQEFRISALTFVEELAPARTFCLLRDVEGMRRQGLARGGDISNAVVVGDDGILNGCLRYPDEFVRHKMIDLLGDLSLLGYPLRGHLVGFKGGHRLHLALVDQILRTPAAWSLSSGRESLAPALLHRYDLVKGGFLAGQPASA